MIIKLGNWEFRIGSKTVEAEKYLKCKRDMKRETES